MVRKLLTCLLMAQPLLSAAVRDKDEGSCTNMKSRFLCSQDAQRTERVFETIGGHGDADLNCIGDLCNKGNKACCTVLTAVRESPFLKEKPRKGEEATKHQKLKDFIARYPADAGSGETVSHADASKPAQPTPPKPAKPWAPKPANEPEPADDSTTVEEPEPADEPGSSASKGIVKDSCMCPTGSRGVNLAGYGPYPKNNFQLKGPGGGRCTPDTSCDKCIRAYGSDRFPCCEQYPDMSMGKCGKEQAKPKFNGAKCRCAGWSINKEQIYEKDGNCLPETDCGKCLWKGSECSK